jgi:uncharacterized membrane protein YdbT with pleckstrin-like domain
MIVLGQIRHLGNKTLTLILYRRTTVAFMLFIASGIVAFLIPSLSRGIAGVAALGGNIDQSQVNHISSVLSSLNLVIFVVSIILFLIGMIVGLLQFRNHYIILDEFSMKMRRGIINHIEVSIPYRQIQDINLDRSLLHRLFGVSRLIMITAGHEDKADKEEADTIFDPIDADFAEEVRDFLDRKIGVQIVESAEVADSAKVEKPANE